jgi:hypothetical protein
VGLSFWLQVRSICGGTGDGEHSDREFLDRRNNLRKRCTSVLISKAMAMQASECPLPRYGAGVPINLPSTKRSNKDTAEAKTTELGMRSG